MGKYNESNTATPSNMPATGGNSSYRKEKATAWLNLTFRLKDGTASQMGIPFMESDYVQRTIMTHMRKQVDDLARKELLKKLLCKAIDNGDFDFRFVIERDESAIGDLDL